MGQIAILIDATLHNELVLRTRKSQDVTGIIEHAIESFLERTKYEDMWSEDYLSELREIEENGQLATYGDPTKGYQWQMLFLPNGTKLQITYKGRAHQADVRHGKIIADKIEYSPSEWARRVANNTNRNAWRDIWVQFPGSSQWELADAIRWAAEKGARS
ncbi:hypothetical protein [Mesorhizobium sp.]|uniref:hypothetical protein n=1 Tax=Mesorhizobium sp. TaxID=1871066 RepID=UPI000FE8FDDE|nr:hypothetical protein [Mesorhizobium sp.]RWD44089.1 MAG: hypothetical protein EOS35_18220 [Mesorhizobium sp.]